MLVPTSGGKVYVKFDPIDFRKGIDGLVSYVEQALNKNPRSGHLFVFCNRQKTGIKILYYDGTGYFLCHKRFSSGRIRNWPKRFDEQNQIVLSLQQLVVLIYDGNLERVNFKEDFEKVEL